MTITARWEIFFQSVDDEGWSEGGYLAALDLPTAASSLDTIITARKALLDPNFSMIYARVSDVAVKGDSLPPASTVMPVQGTYAGVGTTLEANTALNVLLFADPSKKNRIFMRGLNGKVVAGREYLAPSDWDTAFTAWVSALSTVGEQVRHRTAIGPPPTYAYAVMASSVVIGATARKPGRPFGLPVGRRSVP